MADKPSSEELTPNQANDEEREDGEALAQEYERPEPVDAETWLRRPW